MNKIISVQNGDVYRISANPEKGFNFDYLLYIPFDIKEESSLLFESMNYSTNKTFDEEEAVEYMCNKFCLDSNPLFYINQNYHFPILMPLIPRYYDNELRKEIFTNQLSSTCFNDKIEIRYRRVDKQVISMIRDAKRKLSSMNILVEDKIIMNGFSSSAKFANHFAIIHPDKVKMVIAGGLDGCLTLPMRDFNGEKLLYPVGIGNMEEVTDAKIEEFKKIKQFYFQGDKDKTDAYFSTESDNYVPYFNGIIEKNELKQLYNVFGRSVTDRWERTKHYYDKLGCNATFKTYKAEHVYTNQILDDIVGIIGEEYHHKLSN